MTYEPLTSDKKAEWKSYLEQIIKILDDQPEFKTENSILNSEDGDTATIKDIVGTFYATIINNPVTIN